MTALQTLEALLELPLPDDALALLRWELFWYQAVPQQHAEDAKRETLPLKLALGDFANLLAQIPGCRETDDGDLVIPLAGSPRQPDHIVFSPRARPYFPAGASVEKNSMVVAKTTSLADALLLAQLSARYPQLAFQVEGSFDQANVEDLSAGFRRWVFRGIILGRRPSAGLRLLDRLKLLELFLPEVTAGRGLMQNRFHAYDIYEHLLRSLDAAYDLKEPVRWAALLHDIGKVPTRVEMPNGEATFHNHEMFSARMVVPIMKRLGVPIAIGQKVKFLVRNHMFHYTSEWTDRAVRRFVRKVPLEELQDLISLRLADRKGSGKKTAFPKALQQLIDHIEEVVAKEKEFKIRDLAIDGYVLMDMGIPPSRQMGDMLRYLHAEVVAGRVANEAEALKELVRRKLAEQS
ncbi:MAG: HD domain-containing protein [Turneriella sp.]|nr:HD domain-containing protein [Turneriella sp.]